MSYGEFLALESLPPTGHARSLVVVNRESSKDGFIITAYLASDTSDLGEERESMAKSLLTVSKLEKIDVDYDGTGDVLYISFGPPIAGSDSRVLDNDVVVRFKGERIVGITIPSFREEAETSLG